MFGIQEADLRIQDELPELVSRYTDKYAWWFFSPYSQDGKGDKAQGIVYDSTRFTMKDSHYFWLSETPDVMSSAWDEKKYNRGACCFTFNDGLTGKNFFVMVIHAPLGKEASRNCVDVVMKKYDEYNPDGLPAIFVGDFNARPDNPASVHFREYWTDSFLAVGEENRKGPAGTFNGHDSDIRLDFLKKGKKYVATIYADAKDADYLTNPQAYKITRRKVDADTRLKLHAVAAGGFAISIVPED